MALRKLGRYEILGELGKGAMGIVYLARDPVIGRQLAIKTFRAPFSPGDRELELFRARFMQEAKSAGNLSHPNIVTIHDVMAGKDGAIFLVMEYVKGTDLKQLMQRRDRLDPRFVVDVVAQIADGLDHAHAKGIVHRDVKPANIILTADKLAKITDFGIAHMDTSNLTAEGQLLGTPNYMSPEMIRGQAVDHRADIFSLGVVLYEMLTRQKPFAGQNLTVVAHRIVSEPFTPPEEIVSGLPRSLAAVLDRSLAKDPGERYARAGEMARDLRAVYAPAAGRHAATGSFLTAHAIPPPPASGAPAPAAAPEAGAASTTTRVVPEPASAPPAGPTPSRKTPPALSIAGVVVALGLAVAGLLSFVGKGPGDARPGAETGQAEEAPALAGDAAATDGGAADDRLAATRRALGERDYRRAIELAEEVLELDPQSRDARQLLAEAQEGQRRKDQVRERFRDGVPAAAENGGESVAPPAAPPAAGKATLEIDFRSELAAGRVTIYAGQEKIYQESFQFGRKRALRRSQPVSGRLTASRELPAGEVTLRVYVTLKDSSQTRTAEVDADLPPGGAATLEITLSPEGRLRAQIGPVS